MLCNISICGRNLLMKLLFLIRQISIPYAKMERNGESLQFPASEFSERFKRIINRGKFLTNLFCKNMYQRKHSKEWQKCICENIWAEIPPILICKIWFCLRLIRNHKWYFRSKKYYGLQGRVNSSYQNFIIYNFKDFR